MSGNTNSRKPYTAATAVGAANATDTVTTVQHRPQFLHLLLLPQVSVNVAVPIPAAVILVCSTDHVRTRCGCCWPQTGSSSGSSRSSLKQSTQHLPLENSNPSCRCNLRVAVAVPVTAAVLYMAVWRRDDLLLFVNTYSRTPPIAGAAAAKP